MSTNATAEILRAQIHDLELNRDKMNDAIAALRAAVAALGSDPDDEPAERPAARPGTYSITAPKALARGRKKTRKAERLEDRILAALDAHGGVITSSDIRLATGAESHHVAAALRSLETRGLVRATDEIGQRVAGRGPAPKVYRRVGLPQSKLSHARGREGVKRLLYRGTRGTPGTPLPDFCRGRCMYPSTTSINPGTISYYLSPPSPRIQYNRS